MGKTDSNISYSVVIPAYNCKGTIKQLCTEIVETFDEVSETVEIVIVNDGGEIDAWNEIQEVYDDFHERITVIRFTKNYGQHNAILCGIDNSVGDFIITIDDDLQIRPKEILKLIEESKNSNLDLIYGVYQKKHHSLLKNLGSSYIKKVSKIVLKSPGDGSSFRLITRKLAIEILQHSQSFVFIDELLLWYTDSIGFVVVEHEKRKDSKSGYSPLKLFNITTHYTAIPLKIMTYAGIVFSFLSFLLGLYFIYRKLFKDVPLGYTSVIVTVLFSTSIILLSLGIVGQYLYKLYQAQNKKPSYTIKKKLRK